MNKTKHTDPTTELVATMNNAIDKAPSPYQRVVLSENSAFTRVFLKPVKPTTPKSNPQSPVQPNENEGTTPQL